MKVLERNTTGRIVASTVVLAAVFVLSALGTAQEVRNTSYVAESGERVLRIETIVPVSTENVWKAWTSPPELSQWIAPVVAIDLKIGGTISTNYDQRATIADPGTIRLPIVNYIEKQLITFKVNLNEKFPKSVRDQDRNLQEIVQIVDLGDGKSKVVSSMVGWGAGKDWDQTYDFFARGNEWTYRELARYLSPPAPVTTAERAPTVDAGREQVVKIASQIRRADYEGDRDALKRLYNNLSPIPEEKKLASRVLYWRGFALWRRAANGFNDANDPKEIGEDLKQAFNEFSDAIARDPGFVDAEAGAASCLNSLIFLNRRDPERVQELAVKAGPLIKQAEAQAPDNPRLLWVLGSIRWYAPAERGGGQDKSLAAQQKGLEAIREHKEKENVSDLDPAWGEPELLMSLAWSNLNRTVPDLAAAEQYAQAALKLVPYWHYVRDILMPQIRAAQAKAANG